MGKFARVKSIVCLTVVAAAMLITARANAQTPAPDVSADNKKDRPALVFLVAGQSNALGIALFAPEFNKHFERVAPQRKAIADYESKEMPALQAKWEKTFDAAKLTWHPLTASKAESKLGAKLQPLEDASILASGPNKTGDLYTIEAPVNIKRIGAVRLELLPHPSLPKGGPGREPDTGPSGHGRFVVSGFKVSLVLPDQKPAAVKLRDARANYTRGRWYPAKMLDEKENTGWQVGPGRAGRPAAATFVADQPIDIPDGARLIITIGHPAWASTVGRFRLSVAQSQDAAPFGFSPNMYQPTWMNWEKSAESLAKITELLKVPAEKRTPKQKEELAFAHRGVDQKWQALQAELLRLQAPNPGTTAKEIGLPITRDAYPRSFIWNLQAKRFQLFEPGTRLMRAGLNCHGIELPMAWRLEKLYPEHDKYFIKVPAVGSLALLWNPAGPGRAFPNFMAAYHAGMADLKKRYPDVRVIGLYWDQGESDRPWAKDYDKNLRTLIAAFRKQTGIADLTILVRRHLFQYGQEAFAPIMKAQVDVARDDPNVHLLDIGLGSNEKNFRTWAWLYPNGHLSSKAYLALTDLMLGGVLKDKKPSDFHAVGGAK